MKRETDGTRKSVGFLNTQLSTMNWSSRKNISKEVLTLNYTLDKIDFKIKSITRDKERHYIMIKRSIQEEDITIVNI